MVTNDIRRNDYGVTYSGSVGDAVKNSAIEWTDHTFNPWHGCTKVSPGCKNCYAEAMTNRFAGKGFWGPQGERRFFGAKHWNQPLVWNRKAEKLGVRHKVFCGSMCDVFEEHPDEEINKKMIFERGVLWNTIDSTPNLDWLLLTKRPENIMQLGQWHWYSEGYPDNVWLGTSVENQEQADIRIPELLKIPAKIRFLSVEPLLEEIDIYDYFIPAFELDSGTVLNPNCVDWVIVGGESGLRKRPFDPDWARSIRDQCKGTGIPFFMKQIDKVKPIPDDLMIREFPE